MQAVLEKEKSTATVAQASVAAQISDLTRKVKLNEDAVAAEKAKQAELEVSFFFYFRLSSHPYSIRAVPILKIQILGIFFHF